MRNRDCDRFYDHLNDVDRSVGSIRTGLMLMEEVLDRLSEQSRDTEALEFLHVAVGAELAKVDEGLEKLWDTLRELKAARE